MRSFLLLIIVLSCYPAFAQNSNKKSKLDSIAVTTINETFNDKLYKWESKFIIEQIGDTIQVVEHKNSSYNPSPSSVKYVYRMNSDSNLLVKYSNNSYTEEGRYYRYKNGQLQKQVLEMRSANKLSAYKEINYHYTNNILDQISWENNLHQKLSRKVESDEFGRIKVLHCSKNGNSKIDTCFQGASYFSYRNKNQLLPSKIVKQTNPHTSFNIYDFAYDSNDNIVYKCMSFENKEKESAQVQSEQYIKYNSQGTVHQKTGIVYHYPFIADTLIKMTVTNYAYDSLGNLTLINILQKSNEKTLSEIKITIEYKDENAVPFDYTHGAILGLEKLGFRNTTCSINSYTCSHEIVFENRPKFILKHIPSRVRKYIKVAEPDIWNLASESIFHTSIN